MEKGQFVQITWENLKKEIKGELLGWQLSGC